LNSYKLKGSWALARTQGGAAGAMFGQTIARAQSMKAAPDTTNSNTARTVSKKR
jgi:hypothetical protein